MRERNLVSASELTTFKIGGLASKVYEPENISALIELLKNLSDYYILGNGSNVVFNDLGINKPIIHLSGELTKWGFVNEIPDTITIDCHLTHTSQEKETVYILAYAGCSIMRLSSTLSNLFYSGLEFAAGIPGSIGGAIAMNAGAHNHEISEITEAVYLLDKAGQVITLRRNEINFEYRKSGLDGLIIAACFKLTRSNSAIENRRSCLEYRKNTQPLTYPSAGSVFININQNDLITHAASLLEGVGLKGFRLGGLQFSELHSNWLVKVSEDAKAQNFLDLVNLAKNKVKEKYGIELQTEIKFWS